MASMFSFSHAFITLPWCTRRLSNIRKIFLSLSLISCLKNTSKHSQFILPPYIMNSTFPWLVTVEIMLTEKRFATDRLVGVFPFGAYERPCWQSFLARVSSPQCISAFSFLALSLMDLQQKNGQLDKSYAATF